MDKLKNEKNKIEEQLQIIENANAKIREIAGIIPVDEKIVKTKVEFDKVIGEFVTSRTMKTNLLNGSKELSRSEVKYLESRGLPDEVWDNPKWFRKKLK